MKICLYTDTGLPKVGGQELVIDALARRFVLRGHEVTVVTPRPKGRLTLNDSAYPYHVVRHPRFYSTRHFVGWYRYFLQRAVAQVGKQDVLHVHGLYPSGYVAALGKANLGLPMVLTSHGGDVYQRNVRLGKPKLRERHELAVRNADRIVVISRFTDEGLRKFGATERQLVEIPNGVDVGEFEIETPRPSALDPEIRAGGFFLFTGRLIRRKGVDVLLKAVALRHQHHLSGESGSARNGGGVELVVAGSGPERENLERLAMDLGVSEKVRFVGTTAGEMKRWLFQHAIATVVPSRQWEAFGLIVLESYASGRPVIATRHPGLADLVREGETGLLVEEESPEALSRAMERIRPVSDRLGLNARRMASDYEWDSVADRHIDLYTALCRRRDYAEGVAYGPDLQRSTQLVSDS